MTTELTIQEVADRTGFSAHTLRYYERVGLIPSVGRRENGHRCYSEDDLGWIEFLTCLRGTGMPIAQMRQYAVFQRQGDTSMIKRLALLKAHREAVLAQIAELEDSLAVIEHKISYYSDAVQKTG